MKIDAHQHFWIYDTAQYPWIDPVEMQVLRQDYLPTHLREEQQPLGIQGTVAVQALQSLEESRWLLSLAEKTKRILAVVGWVDLRSNDVEHQLAGLASHPKLAGVRHVVQDEPDDQFLIRPDFLRGIASLAIHGLVYDLLIYPKQLPAAVELARRFPQQPFVLDHMAKPPIREGGLSPWKAHMKELAGHTNVTCKISGLVTEARWHDWQRKDFRPYLDVVFDLFGPDRLMFGSDWPVCLLSANYQSVYDILDEYLGADEEARRKVMGKTAARIYHLPRGDE